MNSIYRQQHQHHRHRRCNQRQYQYWMQCHKYYIISDLYLFVFVLSILKLPIEKKNHRNPWSCINQWARMEIWTSPLNDLNIFVQKLSLCLCNDFFFWSFHSDCACVLQKMSLGVRCLDIAYIGYENRRNCECGAHKDKRKMVKRINETKCNQAPNY